MSRHRSVASPHRDHTVAVLLTLVAACACGTLLAACGGSAAGTPPPTADAASPAPSPVPSPLITSGPPPAAAVDVVRSFWTLLGAGKLAEAKRTLVAPGAPIQQWNEDAIASARFVKLVSGSVGRGPAEGATMEFSVIVWIEEDAASGSGVWGDPGEHQMFEHVVRMSDGAWRMWDSGTGP
jgi:hypothetical protein